MERYRTEKETTNPELWFTKYILVPAQAKIMGKEAKYMVNEELGARLSEQFVSHFNKSSDAEPFLKRSQIALQAMQNDKDAVKFADIIKKIGFVYKSSELSYQRSKFDEVIVDAISNIDT